MSEVKISNHNKRKIIITFLGICLSVGGLVYAFYGVDFDELYETRKRIEVFPLLFSIVVYWAGLVVFRSLMVRHLLSSVGKIPVMRAYRCLSIGFLANNIFPLRIGDLVRSGAVSKGTGIPFPSVIGGLALERMMDLAMIALIAFLAFQMSPLPDDFKHIATIYALGIGAGFVGLFFMARSSKGKSESDMGGLRAWVWNLWLRFSSGFGAFQSMRSVVIFVLLGMCIWSCGVVSFIFRLEAFGLEGSLANSLIMITLLGLGVSLPSAPGYVGVYHAAAAFALGLIGVDPAVAAAFGLFSWFADITTGNIAGAIGMVFEGMKLRDLRQKPTI